MTGQIKPEEQREYTIKIIPHQGETVHSIRLPWKLVRYGLMSLAAGALLFVGSFGYAAYSAFEAHADAQAIQDLQQVGTAQQEKLAQLAKQANQLQDEMDKLNEIEQELARVSGVSVQAQPTAAVTEPSGGQGGPWVQPDIKNVRQALETIEQRMTRSRDNLEAIRAAIAQQQESAAYRQQQISMTIPSGWPSGGEVSSSYGLRWGGSDFHPGVDIADDYGTPIYATADGIVTAAGWNSGGYGNMVDIDHGNGLMTRYGHADEVVVREGDAVKRGQLIAFMGSTGFSTGPHVHYEVHQNGEVINPFSYMER